MIIAQVPARECRPRLVRTVGWLVAADPSRSDPGRSQAPPQRQRRPGVLPQSTSWRL